MARLNSAALRQAPIYTEEGAPAVRISAESQLRRLVLSCLLWEKEFYVDGKSIADQITAAAQKVSPEVLAALAIEARSSYNLRHVPLLLLDVLSKTAAGTGTQLVQVATFETIQRVDDMAELLAVMWRSGKNKGTMPKQVKLGLQRAFEKFDEYGFAKYEDQDAAIKLRDVVSLVHPKPENKKRSKLYKRILENKLERPDTWESALVGGADKKETFTRLLLDKKLGYLALLRNLRNMAQAGVDPDYVKDAIVARKGGADRVFPFRFIAAARACPQFEPALDVALCANIAEMPALTGKTIVLVDISGSMDRRLSEKSDLTRADAAAALASVIHGDLRVFSFTNNTKEVPARRGMAGVQAILESQSHGSTYLGAAVEKVNALPHDRLIVITDEQSHDRVPAPKAERAYMINVASNQNGVGYGKQWVHLDGFSEAVLRFIVAHEDDQDNAPKRVAKRRR